MWKFLNKVFGALIGFILYPIKAAFVSFLLTVFILLRGALTAIAVPFVSFFVVLFSSGNLALASLAFLIGIVTAVTHVIWPTLVAANASFRSGIRDIIDAMVFGIFDGFENGLFPHVLSRFVFDFIIFNRILTELVLLYAQTQALNEERFEGLRGNPNDYVDDGADIDYSTLQDVEVDKSALDALSHAPKQQQRAKFIPLTPDELQLAEKIEGLQDHIRSYKNLNDRLTKLDEALAKRREAQHAEEVKAFGEEFDREDPQLRKPLEEISQKYDAMKLTKKLIDDEFVPMMNGIKKPILFVKEYKYEEEKWRVVPSTTFVTDEDTVREYYGKAGKHPLLNDNVGIPSPYSSAKYPTQYKYYTYTSKEDSTELMRATAIIRAKVEQIQSAGLGQVAANMATSFAQTFFSASSEPTPEPTPDVTLVQNQPESLH